MKPTEKQYEAYQNIFDYFNKKLFNNKLHNVILSFSRHKGSRGFFAPERWEYHKKNKNKKHTHEIALNPESLDRKPLEVVSTLVHEMAHLWQQDNGTPSRTGYHNKQWAEKMESIGLIPSDTGKPGGNKVGQHMTHYIQDKGVYERAFNSMPKKYLLPFKSFEMPGLKKKKKRSDKVKYNCPSCDINVWGKSGLNLSCVDCDELMEELD